jgi:hypothetical protein
VRLALTGPPSAIDLNVYRDGLPAVTMIGLSRVQQPSLGGGATKVGTAPVNAPLLKLAAQGDAAAPRASGWWLSDLFDRWIKSSRPSGARTN